MDKNNVSDIWVSYYFSLFCPVFNWITGHVTGVQDDVGYHLYFYFQTYKENMQLQLKTWRAEVLFTQETCIQKAGE